MAGGEWVLRLGWQCCWAAAARPCWLVCALRARAACLTCCRYRTLDEQEHDPEGGPFSTTSSAAGASAPGGGAHNAVAAVELTAAASNASLKSIDMGGHGPYHASPRAPPRGITTPQKLQRSVSNAEADAAALGGGAASILTPRAGTVPTPRTAGALTPRASGSSQSPLR